MRKRANAQDTRPDVDGGITGTSKVSRPSSGGTTDQANLQTIQSPHPQPSAPSIVTP